MLSKDVVADTHSIYWFLQIPSMLSTAAAGVMNHAAQTGRIFVSTSTVIELTYLTEKGKLPAYALSDLWDVAIDPHEPIELIPITADMAHSLASVPRVAVPDMPDRIIAATALNLGLPLVSADHRIRSLNLPGLTVIW